MSSDKNDMGDLFIRTPMEEFKAFSRHRIEILEKFKEVDKLRIYMDAYELGIAKLNDALAPLPVPEEEDPPPLPLDEAAPQTEPDLSEEDLGAQDGDVSSEQGEERSSESLEEESVPPASSGILTAHYDAGSDASVQDEGGAAVEVTDEEDGDDEPTDASSDTRQAPSPAPQPSPDNPEIYIEPSTVILEGALIAEFHGEDTTAIRAIKEIIEADEGASGEKLEEIELIEDDESAQDVEESTEEEADQDAADDVGETS